MASPTSAFASASARATEAGEPLPGPRSRPASRGDGGGAVGRDLRHNPKLADILQSMDSVEDRRALYESLQEMEPRELDQHLNDVADLG